MTEATLSEVDAASGGVSPSTSGASATGSAAGNTGVVPPYLRRSYGPTEGPMVLVPAGIFGNIIGALAETAGEVAGEYFGNKELGKTLGATAGPLIKHFSPFEVYAPDLAPQSSGSTVPTAGPDEPVVVVPAGFLSGIAGGLVGKLAGGAIGNLFGNKQLGEQLGGGLGGAAGSFFGPFDLAVPQQVVDPSSTSPDDAQQPSQEAMIVVPAGWFGQLVGATAGSIGDLIAGKPGRQVGEIAGELAKQLIPWSAVPGDFAPQAAGPDGTSEPEQLVVVPAGWFADLVSNCAGVIGSGVGGLLGNAQAGREIGEAAKPLIKMIPFNAVPDDALQPAAAGEPAGKPEDKLIFVPAGLVGSLLSSYGGLLGTTVGGIFGHGATGGAIGDFASKFGKYVPFSVAPDRVS